MKYPHAYSGVKKLFIAEIISLIATIVVLVSAIITTVGVASNENVPAIVSGGTLALISGIALIVSFILQLIGYLQAGKDHSNFKVSFWVTIIAIVATFVGSILGVALPDNDVAQIFVTVFDAFTSVSSVIVLIYVLGGIASLAMNLKDRPMAQRGRTLAYVVVILFIISVALNFIPKPLAQIATSDGWKVAFAVFAIIAATIEIIVYFAVLVYYKKAIRMLKK